MRSFPLLCAVACLVGAVLVPLYAVAQSPGKIHNQLLRSLHREMGHSTPPVDRATFEERLEFMGLVLADRSGADERDAARWKSRALEAMDAAGLFDEDPRGEVFLADPQDALDRMVDYQVATGTISPRLASVYRRINAMSAGRELARFIARDLPAMGWEGRDADRVADFVDVAVHSLRYWRSGRSGGGGQDAIIRASDKERFDSMCYDHIWNYGWENGWDPAETFQIAYHGSAALSDAAYR